MSVSALQILIFVLVVCMSLKVESVTNVGFSADILAVTSGVTKVIYRKCSCVVLCPSIRENVYNRYDQTIRLLVMTFTLKAES